MTPHPNPDTLRAILAKLESATGPDRALDNVIWLRIASAGDPDALLTAERPLQAMTWGEISVVVPTYTSSLDAAVALAEHVLPGWWWDVCTYEPARYEAFVNPPDYRNPDDDPCGMGIDETPARAIVRAIIRALISVNDHARRVVGPFETSPG